MNVVCDIDGVVYRGESLIEGSDVALQRVVDSGIGLFFATNNSTRTPTEVQNRIERISGVEVCADSIVNSSQAAAQLLSGQETTVLVFGSDAIRHAMEEASIPMTEAPDRAGAVVVGLDWEFDYQKLSGATEAVRRGARFIATNVDPTYPVAGGLLPGSGAMVAAVATASGVQPEVAGKPHLPMRELLRARGVGPAWVIGDRVDTDVALAAKEDDWRSILVLTGVTEEDTSGTADHVALDLAAAIDLVLGGELEQ